ncbi:MAG: ribonuclease E activity regulator RraA [Planctomycetes bacterium]|nr:ribonuclease E activity regulator RraA [Planctomycetota bacterium]
MRTADLCDAHADRVQVLRPGLASFGGRRRFAGEVRTLQVFEDNVLVKQALAEPGHGAVLVVDGGGSRRCALLGDVLAASAVANGWTGVVVAGCVRDGAVLATLDLGVLALGTHPMRSVKRGAGVRDEPIEVLGARVVPGMWLYADEDGVLVSDARID